MAALPMRPMLLAKPKAPRLPLLPDPGAVVSDDRHVVADAADTGDDVVPGEVGVVSDEVHVVTEVARPELMLLPVPWLPSPMIEGVVAVAERTADKFVPDGCNARMLQRVQGQQIVQTGFGGRPTQLPLSSPIHPKLVPKLVGTIT